MKGMGRIMHSKPTPSQASRFESWMRSITKWGFFTVFAATPGNFFVIFDCDFHGRQIRSRVWSITKGLGLWSAASTPIVGAGLHVHDIWCSLRNDDRVGHAFLLDNYLTKNCVIWTNHYPHRAWRPLGPKDVSQRKSAIPLWSSAWTSSSFEGSHATK